MRTEITCPRCGDVEHLQLVEIHDEIGWTHPGRIRVDEHGGLIPPGVFYFEVGSPSRVEVKCESCGHVWTPRQRGGVHVAMSD